MTVRGLIFVKMAVGPSSMVDTLFEVWYFLSIPVIWRRVVRRESVEVHCYSGHTYAERPDSFLWQGKRLTVSEILKSWREPGTRHFKVRTEDGRTFHLVYNEIKAEWSITEREGKHDEEHTENTGR